MFLDRSRAEHSLKSVECCVGGLCSSPDSFDVSSSLSCFVPSGGGGSTAAAAVCWG